MFFSIFQVWRLVFLEPLGVQRHTVAHFKGLIYAKVVLEAQGSDSTFTPCHALLKKAILHPKTAIVRIFFRLTVGVLSEQAFESVHYDFLETWKRFKYPQDHKEYGQKLLDAVVNYNSFDISDD